MQNVQTTSRASSVLTPRQLAKAIGVSESSVKRWIDDGHIEATRTAGGHRRIALEEATRYVRRTRSPLVRPEILALDEIGAVAESDDADLGTRLFGFLRDGAAVEARGLVLSSYLEGASVAEIVDGPLTGAMVRVGEIWRSDPAGIYHEHRATQIALQALGRLRLVLSPEKDAPHAVGGAPAGDRYILASLAAAAVLEGEGLQAANLGPETPIGTLAVAIEDLDAPLAWLSVSVADDPAALGREIEGLAPRLAERGTLLVVGGAAASKLRLAPHEAIYSGGSMGELAAVARGMRIDRSAARS